MEGAVRLNHAIHTLSEDECLFLLHSHDLGRLAFNVHGRPDIVPVNYAIEGRIIVFKTSPGTKLKFAPGTHVAFEVDSWNHDGGNGWSVVVRGMAYDVTLDPGRTAEHIRRARVYPVVPGDHRHWIAIRGADISGRRIDVQHARRARL